MNADPFVQLKLLDLQAADTALAQLAHRRRTLPQLATIAERTKTRAALANEVVDAQTALDDIALEQRRVEADVDVVRARVTRDEQRLAGGGLPARELESLQHELTSLARRQSTLEDEVLDLMEQAEQAQGSLEEAGTRLTGLDGDLAELTATRDAALAEIDAAVAERTPQRAALAAGLPEPLVALYDKTRAGGGAGAALLRQRRCEGCRIDLSGSELSAIRQAPVDAVVRCENCRAILVRTDESGL